MGSMPILAPIGSPLQNALEKVTVPSIITQSETGKAAKAKATSTYKPSGTTDVITGKTLPLSTKYGNESLASYETLSGETQYISGAFETTTETKSTQQKLNLALQELAGSQKVVDTLKGQLGEWQSWYDETKALYESQQSGWKFPDLGLGLTDEQKTLAILALLVLGGFLVLK